MWFSHSKIELAEKLGEDQHLVHCVCSTLTKTLETFQTNSLAPFPPGLCHDCSEFFHVPLKKKCIYILFNYLDLNLTLKQTCQTGGPHAATLFVLCTLQLSYWTSKLHLLTNFQTDFHIKGLPSSKIWRTFQNCRPLKAFFVFEYESAARTWV